MKPHYLPLLIALASFLTGGVSEAAPKSKAASSSSVKGPEVVEVASFGVKPGSGEDAAEGIRRAIEECHRTGARKLVFAPGVYDLWPDRAFEKYLFITNNDEGLKRIAFPLIGFKNLEIEGNGASFLFHGPMIPFDIENSNGITVKNLSFDFKRAFHSEGKVLAVTPDSADIEFSSEFPYEIRGGILVFTNGEKKNKGPETTVKSGEIIYPYGSLLAFDPKRRETAYMAKDCYSVGAGIVAKEIGPRQVRLSIPKLSAEPGNVLSFGAAFRNYPGFFISDSSGVTLDNVTIHHAGAMGVVAQRSADITLERVRVTPPEGKGRVVSASADATHFLNCRGKIRMIDCLFENQKDDATNIHGLYARITRVLAPDRFEIRLVHPQQVGVDFVKSGTTLEISHGPSLQPLGTAKVASVERLNKELTLVTLAKPFSEKIVPGDIVADAEANTADVLIKNCVIRGNRARGILLGSRGPIVVEGNTFHTPGTAILFEGDGQFWYEQAGVRDVVIKGNTFDNCNFGVWGKGCIAVGSGIDKPFRATTRYNKNIVIEDNLFRRFDDQPLLSMYSVDGLKFRNNRLEKTTEYLPVTTQGSGYFDITNSDHVTTEEPVTVNSPAVATPKSQ
jgi:hypothetical protein